MKTINGHQGLAASDLSIWPLAMGVLLAIALAFADSRADTPVATLDREAESLPEEQAAEAPTCCAMPSRLAALRATATSKELVVSDGLTVEPTEAGAKVLVDGELFAEYVTDAGTQPSVWPIIGPSGHEMTRSLPLGPARPAERNDHPHHRSLWFAHGDVNGHDFWHLPEDPATGPRIAHREFVRSGLDESGLPVLVAENDWMVGDQRLLSDERTLRFGVVEPGDPGSPRYLDFSVRLMASDGPVEFGDTKEGSFAVRVPGPMKLDAGLGGRVFNSRGEGNADAWGRPARWVAYEGPLEVAADGALPALGGVVIMTHPDGFRPACRWHVRGYGLFAANPFGESDFPQAETTQGAVALEQGGELFLAYRVVFYSGSADIEAIDRWYDLYTTSLIAGESEG